MPPKTLVGVDTPQMEAFLALMRAQELLARALDSELEEQRGISMVEYFLLLNLRYAPEGRLLLGELATEVRLTKSGTTRLVDRMVERGFVERVPCPTDRRSVYAVITDAGKDELRKAWPVHRRGIDEHFGSRLSNADASTLRDLLEQVIPAE